MKNKNKYFYCSECGETLDVNINDVVDEDDLLCSRCFKRLQEEESKYLEVLQADFNE